MKKLYYLIALIVALGLIVPGCIPVVPPTEQNESGVFPDKGIGDPGEIWNQTTNTQYFTIQAAITAASDSDIIIVGSGEYVEQLTINETLTLQGSGLPTLNVSGFVGSQGVDVSAPNVVIEGFRFIGVPPASNTDFSSNTNPTIRAFAGASGLTVQNNVFDPPSGVINAGKEALLITDGVHNVSFLNNEVNDYIYGLTGRGWTEGTDNILVQGNTFTQTELLEGLYSGVTEFLTEAVQLWSGDGLKVIDNTFTGPGKFADQFETDNLVNVYAVADFNAYFYAAYGVGTGTETIEITDNEISNYHLGIGVFSGGTIQNNTISDLTVGIQIGQKDPMFATAGITDTLNIIGNDILNNLERGIWVQLTGGEQVEVHYNNIVGNGEFGVEKTNIFDEPSVIVDATYNWWGHPGGPRRPAGNSDKISGPKTADQVSENVLYHPWLSGTNSVSNIALDQDATASATYQPYTAARAVDGDYNTSWIADGYPPQWIEIDLSKGSSVVGLRFLPDQTRAGLTTHVVMFSNDGGVVGYYTLTGVTEAKQWVEAWFDAPFRGVRTVRVTTEVDTLPHLSWVAWFEIEVYGWQ